MGYACEGTVQLLDTAGINDEDRINSSTNSALRDKALGDRVDFMVNLWSKKRNKAIRPKNN